MVSELDVDERGHLIWAEGDLVLDIDPATGLYKEIRLPPPSKTTVFIPPAGTYITAMALDQKRHAYLSRMNVAALTEVDLLGGNFREIVYPPGFGPVHDLAVTENTIWITNPYDMEGGPRAQAGRIDLPTGNYQAIDGVPAIFVEGQAGKLYGTAYSQNGLAVVTGDALSAAAPAGSAFSGLGVPDGDVVAVDPQSGTVWASNGVVKGLLKLDPSSGSVQSYALGAYLSKSVSCPVPVSPSNSCDETMEVSPVITGIAVAPNGDVYFSDAAFSRIGVIHPGQ
ncbi:MAG TPA: hypothetical protein VLS25_06045 [Dehalococcoidia bacterium]|nr:hypothetical protein [Dehalococcoidia bacterium]